MPLQRRRLFLERLVMRTMPVYRVITAATTRTNTFTDRTIAPLQLNDSYLKETWEADLECASLFDDANLFTFPLSTVCRQVAISFRSRLIETSMKPWRHWSSRFEHYDANGLNAWNCEKRSCRRGSDSQRTRWSIVL